VTDRLAEATVRFAIRDACAETAQETGLSGAVTERLVSAIILKLFDDPIVRASVRALLAAGDAATP